MSATKSALISRTASFKIWFWALVASAVILSLIIYPKISMISCYLAENQIEVTCPAMTGLVGQRFFFSRPEKILASQVIKNDRGQLLQLVDWQKEIPGELKLFFSHRPPLGRLKINDQTYLVTHPNLLSADDPHSSLPFATLTGGSLAQVDLSKGTVNPDFSQELAAWTSAVQDLQIEFWVINDQQSQLKVNGWPVFIFDFDQSAAETVAKIKIIQDQVERPQISSSSGQIDLRFQLPVWQPTKN